MLELEEVSDEVLLGPRFVFRCHSEKRGNSHATTRKREAEEGRKGEELIKGQLVQSLSSLSSALPPFSATRGDMHSRIESSTMAPSEDLRDAAFVWVVVVVLSHLPSFVKLTFLSSSPRSFDRGLLRDAERIIEFRSDGEYTLMLDGIC